MFYKLVVNGESVNLVKNNLIGNTAKLLLFNMMIHMNKQNIIHGSPKELYKKLGIAQHSFEKGMKELKANDLVRKYTKKEYMINPEMVCYGEDRHYYVVKHIWETQTSKGLRD